MLVQALALLSNTSTVAACLSGSCGRAAREWIEAQYPILFNKMRAEMTSVRFRIDPAGWSNVAIEGDSLEVWSAAERALMQCLPDMLLGGIFLHPFFALVAEFDQKIDVELARLREEARSANIGIRGPMFAVTYVLQGPSSPSIGQVCSQISGGSFKKANAEVDAIHCVEDTFSKSLIGSSKPSGFVGKKRRRTECGVCSIHCVGNTTFLVALTVPSSPRIGRCSWMVLGRSG